MPPIADEQTDELKARRQRRKGRQEPPAVNGSTPPSQSAGAARDLLRGLITDGARRDEEGSGAADPGGECKPAPATLECEDRRASESAPKTSHRGEAIDELIRRVKDNAAGAAVEASSTLEQRRPKGTADLARDAATRRAPARRRGPEAELRGTAVAPTRKKRRRAVAGMVLLSGMTIIVVTLAGAAGTSGRRGVASSVHSSRLAAARSGDFGRALEATIAAIAPELRAVAQRAASSARSAATRHVAPHRKVPSRARHARSKHRAAAVQRAPVTNSPPPSTTGTQTQSSTAGQAPASTASQTSATSQPSAKSSSRPAGPIGTGPLGGIGSCVKGC
jgi:hypothetical protein